jgi:hypothetical protein
MPPASSPHPHDSPEQAPPACPFYDYTNSSSWHFAPAHDTDAPGPSFALGGTYDQDGSAYYFEQAYHAEPSPPAHSFLDNILNPAESIFGYHPGDGSMSSPRGQARAGRLSNGYVDLTDSPDVATTSRKTKRESPTPGPSTKRLRRNNGAAAQPEGGATEAAVEEIDLSDGKQMVQHVLQKQREEAVKAQAHPEEKATTFNTFNCVICMDTPTDLTATACGASPPS